ncbi:STAS domain-containing protein [Shewanella sp. SP2S2-4]|jgi:anti-sigma B factor antagonist|uniref:Anti-sigma factor antagonist n=2 Tax=Shewanella TaxID=22 RepID=A0ABU9UWX2_9GAMM|nr:MULTISPECIES: STAS domain-containing protein [Shewanella]AEG09449.1 anti-anti-sigma factor [Shewanella baltica BA175]EHQ17033.1 anti-anti-sigma factor [Shewanella baltica OS183]KZK70144.1 anti-anti-sigma factor [Shewanella baltica]MDT3273507.1 STAS domain-containing protein [Shewanella sp. SP2S2-4]MDT3281579.1 STAS domain-containing protein [Shewanella sp. SP2S1-2]
MKFSPIEKQNASIVTFPTEMIMANTPTHRAALLRHMENGTNRLIINLEEVKYIDSSGLSVLISALKYAQLHDGEILLLSPSDNVRSLIELTRLHQIFTIYECQDAAIAHLSHSSMQVN